MPITNPAIKPRITIKILFGFEGLLGILPLPTINTFLAGIVHLMQLPGIFYQPEQYNCSKRFIFSFIPSKFYGSTWQFI